MYAMSDFNTGNVSQVILQITTLTDETFVPCGRPWGLGTRLHVGRRLSALHPCFHH